MIRGDYTRESTCRECGEPWLSEVIRATYYEPSDETEPVCPQCEGHSTDCCCDECDPAEDRWERMRLAHRRMAEQKEAP